MFGQDHPGVNQKGFYAFNTLGRRAKRIDMAREQIAAPVLQVNGEKSGPTRHIMTTVV